MYVEFFLRRPILSSVLAMLTVIGGAIAIPSLPVARYPTLAAPQVIVSSMYIGASSEVVEAAVTTPLEEAINGVPGMRYIQSSSTSDGLSTVTVTFEPSRNIDLAAIDVQNRVQQAVPRLPAEVRATGVTVAKSSTSIVLALAFWGDPGTYSTQFVSNYVDRYVRNALSRVPGVGEARIFNPRTYAMRLWLDPARLAARGLTAGDVTRALREQNIEIAAGQIGREPAPRGQVLQLSVHAAGRLPDANAFGQLVLRTANDGTLVRLRDVGRVELGAEDYATVLRFNGREATGLGIFQLPDANALDVDRAVRAELDRLARSFPPGLHYQVGFDPTSAVRSSIDDVLVTLAAAIAIVVVVIFAFLQGFRPTVIPALTIPVSLVGTFIFVKAFGFSINTLTLFGLTLATGLVVDDAIVVIENIERHLAEHEQTGAAAAAAAMREVAGAVIATSLVLIAVFVPVAFFPGTTGRIYQQFSLTIAFSIALSAFNALTLSPALSARLLRRGTPHEARRLPLRAINRAMAWAHDAYGRALHRVLRHTWLVIALFGAALAATAWAYARMPSGFVPDEDQGYLIVAVQGPPGAALQQTLAATERVEDILRRTPEIETVFNVNGFSFAGAGSSRAIMFVGLRPFEDRSGPEHTAQAVLTRLSGPLFGLSNAIVIPFLPPSIQGVGVFGGFQLEIEDRGGGPIDRLAQATQGVVGAASRDPRVRGVLSTFTVNDPELEVAIDRERAKALGIGLDQIAETLQVYLGSSYVNDFDFNEHTYRVYVQADAAFRTRPDQLASLYLRAGSGAMVPLDNLVHVTQRTAPQMITHWNLFRAAEINGSPAPGGSTAQAMAAMEELARSLPSGMAYEWAGLSLEQQRAGNQVLWLFALAVVVVFLVLAAQYESFALPLVILFAVPVAILGALALLFARGLISDVFAQIGMIMLVGLASKNAILIVEFAQQLRARGRPLIEAAVLAATIRLRPILMTSFAFIFGVLPLVFARGSGAGSRHSLGTTVLGGMIASTFLNLVFIPVLYVVIEGWRERGKHWRGTAG
ncbi:MAG TPA: multidrug efflux RND transporter permease subunit [Kofleriaceae bacterium]|jgi:HAE1 family hydrophobic/amphiphilic exporter-1|nr:multidrug efflux RND transporter permease subunit [Kofleriaceae bacterium]